MNSKVKHALKLAERFVASCGSDETDNGAETSFYDDRLRDQLKAALEDLKPKKKSKRK